MSNKSTKKIVVGIILLSFLGTFIPSRTSIHSQWVVWDWQNNPKEGWLDLLGRVGARIAFTAITQEMINTVRGSGRNGSAAFVRDWRNYLTEGQYRGEDVFRSILAYTPTCNYLQSSINAQFNITSASTSSFSPFSNTNIRVGDLNPFTLRAKCTLPAGFDIDAYVNDFSGNGGWQAWDRLLEPQNNFFSLYLMSLDEAEKQRSLDAAADLNEAISGQGFTSTRDICQNSTQSDTTEAGVCRQQETSCIQQCIAQYGGSGSTGQLNCQNQCTDTYNQCIGSSGPTNDTVTGPSQARCRFLGQVFTPASILGQSTANTIDQELGWFTSSDEITETAFAIISALIGRLANLISS